MTDCIGYSIRTDYEHKIITKEVPKQLYVRINCFIQYSNDF